jgi:hypothetical protein
MYAKAIELGDDSVIGCWVESIYNSRRIDKIHFAIELLKKHKPEGKNIRFDLLYAKILLWNDSLLEAIDIIKKQTNSIRDIYNNEDSEEKYSHKMFSELVDFFLLLIAKKEYDTALDMFSDSNDFDFRTMLKPVYYLLMDELKEDFPMEYLKAGKELTETINDLKKEIEYMREK